MQPLPSQCRQTAPSNHGTHADHNSSAQAPDTHPPFFSLLQFQVACQPSGRPSSRCTSVQWSSCSLISCGGWRAGQRWQGETQHSRRQRVCSTSCGIADCCNSYGGISQQQCPPQRKQAAAATAACIRQAAQGPPLACRHSTSAPSASASASGLGMASCRTPLSTSFTFFSSACSQLGRQAGRQERTGRACLCWLAVLQCVGTAQECTRLPAAAHQAGPAQRTSSRRAAGEQLTRRPATFQLRIVQAGVPSGSGGARMLASHSGPAGALGLAGARLALGLTALAAAPPLPLGAALSAAAVAGLLLGAASSAAGSGGAAALRLGALWS